MLYAHVNNISLIAECKNYYEICILHYLDKNEEKTKMKRLLEKHPILGGVVVIILTSLFCDLFPAVLAVPVMKFIVMPLVPSLPNEAEALAPIITQFSTVITPICAILCAIIFTRKIRKNGYNGPVKFFNDPDREMWIMVVIYLILCVLRNLLGIFTTEGGWQLIDISFNSIMTPVMAGITEEVIFRLIPLTLMLRYQRDSRQLRKAVFWTSLLFGVAHLINGGGIGTILQSVFAGLMGIFYAAVFLRTGSVVLPALLHFFLDLTVMTLGAVKPESPELNILILFAELVCVAMGIILLRKKKHEEIFKVLDRVWPMEEKADEK